MKIFKTLTRALALGILLISTALAATLEEAKAAGMIGEKQDGYIGFVQANVPADVQALVNEVNMQRRQRYEQIARDNGIDVRDVARLAFTRALEATQSGNYVESAPGQWTRKP